MEKTESVLIEKKQSKSVEHLKSINIDDHWETRFTDLQDAIKKYKVNPIIDVFASSENHKCIKYFSEENSAFENKVDEDAFANPPYSIIDQVMKFLYYQHLNYNKNIMILTYNKTDTKWWHSYVEDRAEVHFVKGRMKFEINGIIPRWCKHCKTRFIENIDYCSNCSLFEPIRLSKNSAPYPSCWIIYRKKNYDSNLY